MRNATAREERGESGSTAGWTLLAAPWQALSRSLAGAAENRRLFVLLPFSAILGLVSYAALPEEPAPAHLATGAVLAIGLLAFSVLWRSTLGMRLAVQFAAFSLGFGLLWLHGSVLSTTMLSFPAYGTFDAHVDEILSADAEGTRVVVSDIVAGPDARDPGIRRARLLIRGEPQIRIGDRIEARLRLAPVPGPVLPGSFDSQFHAYFAGIGAYGSAIGPVTVKVPGSDNDLARQVYGLRSFIAGRIDAELVDASAAIGRAMVVGDQSAITDDIREVMAASGLAHVYSISGLHLSIVAGGVFWLVRWVLASLPTVLFWPIKHIAALAGLFSAFGYLLLAGGLDNIPAFRSTLMLALIFGAVLAGRRAMTMRNVAIAALAIIAIDPASVFRASFQLSFAAVVGLIGIYELPRLFPADAKGPVARLLRFLSTTAWTSLVAGIATLLFSAYHFQQTAPLGVLGNVLALPFVGLIMWFGALAIIAMPVGLDGPFFRMMGWNIDRMVDVARLVAEWSAHLTGNPLLAGWTLLAGLAVLGWFAFIEGHWRLLAPALLVPLVLVFGFEPRPDVLIADSTQAVAVRDGDGMGLVTGRTGSFAVDVWSQHYQTEIAGEHGGTRCDGIGCIVTTPDFRIAVIRNAAAFAEDCHGMDLVITRIYPPRGCAPDAQIIGPSDLTAGGVHWLHWNSGAGRFDIRPAIAAPDRPWRP